MASPFGTYELLDRIAVGGMAEVYLARSREPRFAGRTLVVKRMLPELAETPESVTMFLDEARLGASLRHKHIVEVLDVGQIEKSWFMALEYIDGQDLGMVLKTARDRGDLLPNALAAWIIARAAEGLHFAHEIVDAKTGERLELVHRDVSPANILVARDGSVKVADFGVARSEQQMHKTKTGLVKGKIAYMSPEQVGGQKVDRRTDVFALGVTLWEALTHRRLYVGLSEVEMMKKVYLEQPPPPSTVKPEIDNALETLLMKALTRGRSTRYQTCAELMTLLDGWCAKQTPPPSASELAEWMKGKFVAREVDESPLTPVGRPAQPSSAPKRVPQGPQKPVFAGPPMAAPVAHADDAPVDATERSPIRDLPNEPHDTREADSISDDEIDATETVEPRVPVHSGPPSSSGAKERDLLDVPQQPAPTPMKARTPLPKGMKLRLVGGAPAAANKRKLRELVLYVEDEEANWQVAELRLQNTYELLHARNDQMACEILRTRGGELSAILMDIQLKGSELDGIQLVRLIRGGLVGDKLPTYARGIPASDIPIFFVTAYAAGYSETDLLSVGADKLVTKPVDFTELTLAMTSSLLRRVSLPT